MSTKPHWTQTPEGKAKMASVQRKAWKTKRAKMRAMANGIASKAKKRPAPEKKSFSLVVEGWRITLGRNEVRIDHE